MPDHQWLDGYAVIGTVSRPWGVRGEIKLQPESDRPERYASLDCFFLGDPASKTVRAVEVRSLRAQGEFWRVAFGGVETPEAAEALRGQFLLIPEDKRPALPEGEYYFSDLAGLTVVDDAGTARGRVVEVTEYPSVNVFDLELEEGGRKQRVLAPWVADCIGKIDLGNRTVNVHMDYLADLTSPGEEGKEEA
ncbi:MAG: 16S rRNA processing protein RimM [Fibrobacterales bacterium]|nr:16S rRNA processing protein RimM [Fibrobacterales bacterium]